MQSIQSILINALVGFFGQHFLHGPQVGIERRGGDHATWGALDLYRSGSVLENHNTGDGPHDQSPSWKRPWKRSIVTINYRRATMANIDRPYPVVNGMLSNRRVFDREQGLCVK